MVFFQGPGHALKLTVTILWQIQLYIFNYFVQGIK